jgi:DnaJ-class molecular chaperone
MRTFIFAYQTNYDLGATLVFAETKERAEQLAKRSDHVWDTLNCFEVTSQDAERLVHIQSDQFLEVCGMCRGTGEIHSHNPKCPECDGKRLVKVVK